MTTSTRPPSTTTPGTSDAQHPHHAAVPAGGADRAFDVDAVRGPPATRRRVERTRGDRTAHALPAVRAENRPPHPPIIRRHNGKIACECGTGAADAIRRNPASVCLVAAPDGKPDTTFPGAASFSWSRRRTENRNTTFPGAAPQECEKMSSAAQPERSSRARVGRNAKQAAASSVRPSRASMASSLSLSACRLSTSSAA